MPLARAWLLVEVSEKVLKRFERPGLFNYVTADHLISDRLTALQTAVAKLEDQETREIIQQNKIYFG